MSLWHMAWGYLWNRKLTTALTILSVALAVGLIAAVLTLREETERRFVEEGQEWDFVVGAKGDPLKIVLSTVYYLGSITGNINLEDLERLRADERVKEAYPVCLGDTFQGYRIVGTAPELFEHEWTYREGSPFKLAQGKFFDGPMQVVLGATVAETSGRQLSDFVVGTHGLVDSAYAHEHKAQKYTVVGILERSFTPNDRALFCSVDSIWQVHAEDPVDSLYAEEEPEENDEQGEHDHENDPGHGHEHGRQITAVLVKLHSPADRFQFGPWVNNNFNAIAATPVQEINKFYDQMLETVKAVLLIIGYLVVVISSLSILIGLYLSILQRKRDLAIMRALGASRGEIFGSVIIEAFLVTALGLAAGWLMAILACWGISAYLVTRIGFSVSALTMTADMITAFSVVVLMGMVAGLLPAWQAYRSDVARDLAEL